jgi:hypothetical protein
VNITKDDAGIVVTSPYNPLLVEKIKTISCHKWHPEKKFWSFPNTDGTLEKILKAFEGEEIYIDPSLKPQLNRYVITRDKVPKQSQKGIPHSFEDLRRELISRKYSYKTIKGYVYYNKDLLNFTGKSPYAITDNDIKGYLAYLAEEKQSATSTEPRN